MVALTAVEKAKSVGKVNCGTGIKEQRSPIVAVLESRDFIVRNVLLVVPDPEACRQRSQVLEDKNKLQGQIVIQRAFFDLALEEESFGLPLRSFRGHLRKVSRRELSFSGRCANLKHYILGRGGSFWPKNSQEFLNPMQKPRSLGRKEEQTAVEL
ncbi:hypothetical protein EJ08DRAFT_666868 [Tothia fuscella]|uniref:Uncharacterized protein n=1 Tax=Tothia fuscella TaxID=1048955 RepID=A0A9P4NDK6_9PEZI|nr:hypothetical protein EJ08DRAFT_666868 [Tothia fuscella]